MRTLLGIPVKPIDAAKSRLGAVLDAEERGHLALDWLALLLRAAAATTSIDGVAVVSADPAALQAARAAGATALAEDQPQGLNRAVGLLVAAALDAGYQRLLVVPGDVPGLAPADFELVLAAAPLHGVLAASDQHGRGTSALVLTPPAVVAAAFEGDSLDRHRAAALAAGVDFVELRAPAFDDVDTPDDFTTWRRRQDATRAPREPRAPDQT